MANMGRRCPSHLTYRCTQPYCLGELEAWLSKPDWIESKRPHMSPGAPEVTFGSGPRKVVIMHHIEEQRVSLLAWLHSIGRAQHLTAPGVFVQIPTQPAPPSVVAMTAHPSVASVKSLVSIPSASGSI